ncbi:MAG: type II secretion system F family protein [Candidatus Omnitrophota bacterium]
MPNYQYRAKDGRGKTVDGLMEAASEGEAVEKVNRLGLLPVRVELTAAPVKPEPVQKSETEEKAPARPVARKAPAKGGPIKSKEITAFGRQLSSLIRSGVPILKAIGIISQQSDSAAFKKMLDQIYEDVKNGAPFSASLGKFPGLFPPLYTALVAAGESTGNLDQSLLRVTEYRQKQEDIVSRVRAALIYPMLMGITGLGTIIFMLTFVMPRLLGIFARLGGELPLPTRILIGTSDALRQPWIWVGVAAAVLAGVVLSRQKNEKHALALSLFVLGIPLLGDFALKIEIARFTRTMELLIKSGISVLAAIRTTAPVIANLVLRNDLLKCLQDISEGGSFGRSLRRSKRFPSFMINLISVGEESGKLDESLGEIANFYERETDEAVRILTSLLEPLMILGMGLVVGFIVVAMLLPMFEINMMVK